MNYMITFVNILPLELDPWSISRLRQCHMTCPHLRQEGFKSVTMAVAVLQVAHTLQARSISA
jgi:hypothetical protein